MRRGSRGDHFLRCVRVDLGLAFVGCEVDRNRCCGGVGHASKVFHVVYAWCVLAAVPVVHIFLIALHCVATAENALAQPSALSNLNERFLHTQTPLC